jgi:membrane protease YdiL (CAAX protease family)
MTTRENAKGGPWGFWSTCGWALGVAVAFLIAQTLVVAIVAGVKAGMQHQAGGVDGASIQAMAEELANHGVVLGGATLASALAAGAVVLLAMWLRRGYPLREYLALRRVPPPTLFFWLAVMVAAGVFYDTVWTLLGAEKLPAFMLEAARTGGRHPFYWLGMVLAAPVFEEVFCRGFLLAGWRRSRLGSWGAVTLISAIWAVAHVQYGWLELVWIFLLGLLLGYARLRTRSLWTPLAMHVVSNLLATLQAARHVGVL